MLLGRKIGMTQVYREDGTAVAVTVVQAGPCVVLQKKPAEKNGGVNAVQLGFEPIKDKAAKKPQLGHAKKAGQAQAYRFCRDMRVENLDDYEVGQTIGVEQFTVGQTVDVIGTSRGMGYQGVIKRHHHHGGGDAHGSMFHRSTGGISSSAYPSRVFKLRGMPGQMGNERVTVQSLTVETIDSEENLIAIRGAVPGPKSGLVIVRPGVKAKVQK
ncbi:50S ribosomal protein L3 [bacterium]|nr:50S ribosomal protein L3 [bacterium]